MEITVIKGIQCYEQDGTAYLNLEECARGLGFTTVAASGNEAVRWQRVHQYLVDFGVGGVVLNSYQNACPQFIPENIFYRLAMKAKNAAAEKFQAKIADEVIPSIRKHGAYMTPETIDKMIADPQFGIRLLTELQTEQEQHKITKEEKRRLEAQVEAYTPLVETMKRITASDDLINLETYAKMLNDDFGFTGGRNALIRIMRELGILFKIPVAQPQLSMLENP